MVKKRLKIGRKPPSPKGEGSLSILISRYLLMTFQIILNTSKLFPWGLRGQHCLLTFFIDICIEKMANKPKIHRSK
jgi:hypothetical protein